MGTTKVILFIYFFVFFSIMVYYKILDIYQSPVSTRALLGAEALFTS